MKENTTLWQTRREMNSHSALDLGDSSSSAFHCQDNENDSNDNDNRNNNNNNNNISRDGVADPYNPDSRRGLIARLADLGVDVTMFELLSIEDLRDLLAGIQKLLKAHDHRERYHAHNSSVVPSPVVVSAVDRQILEELVSSKGRISSSTLSRKLDLPRSTIQRRMKRLEDQVVENNYSVMIEKFGWREGTLFVSVRSGGTLDVGRKLLEISDNVVSVYKIMGASKHDLKVEMIFKTNSELISTLEQIRSVKDIENIFWSESIELVGKNKAPYLRVITGA